MAVDSSPISQQKNSIKTPQKKFEPKLKANVTPPPGIRPVRGKTGDSGKGKTCHQCRHQNGEIDAAWCTNEINNKKCSSMYCYKCLMNRYGVKAEKAVALGNWKCPKCQGTCNCSICMKRRGQLPVGRSDIKKASSEKVVKKKKKLTDPKAHGASSVCEKPVKKRKIVRDPKAPEVSSTSEKPVKKRKVARDVVKTPKKELTSVAGIDVPSKHVGNALQFLEFCAVFGKILGVKKGEPEYVLQELLEGEAGGKTSATVQFQIHLLSQIQNERGITSAIRRNSWFDVLKECLSESLSDLKAQGPNSLDVGDDYETLDDSDKLRLLNLVCDEVLGTKKLRTLFQSFITKDAKKMPVDANDEGRRSDLKVEDEGDDKGRKSKPKVENESGKGIIDGIKIPDALRVVPVLVGRGGDTYWKLNAFGKSDVLCQSIGKGDTLSRDEKWCAIDDEGKGMLEKHISSLRGNR